MDPGDVVRRERGAFFTPPLLATALAQWSICTPVDRVLDPSAGDGELLVAAVARLRQLGAAAGTERIEGVEIDPASAVSARARLGARGAAFTIHQADAFPPNGWLVGPFDAVVANPPWVRYHLFAGDRRHRALEAARRHGVELNGRSSFWAPYLVHAVSFLSPLGRLAAVVPAELLHADYAQPVRDFLLRRFRAIHLLAFDERVFLGAEVDALLLLASNDEPGLRVARLGSASDLDGIENQLRSLPMTPPNDNVKWASLLAEPDLLELIAELRDRASVVTLGDVSHVGIGVVTGADRFFFMKRSDVGRHGIPRSKRVPALSTLKNVAGLEISRKDWLALARRGRPAYLFACEAPEGLVRSRPTVAYIKHGESQGHHLSFKCRMRKPWYSFRIPDPADALLAYMVGSLPRFVLNTAKLVASNRVHRVMLCADAPRRQVLAASFLSTLTQVSAEIEGRSYGGGVLKLEPSDARRLLLVAPTGARAQVLESKYALVDSMLRRGQVDEAVALVDEVALMHELGLSPRTVERLRQGLAQLRARRSNRAH